MGSVNNRFSRREDLTTLRTNKQDNKVNLTATPQVTSAVVEDLKGAIASNSDNILLATEVNKSQVGYAEMTPDEAKAYLSSLETALAAGEPVDLKSIPLPESTLARNSEWSEDNLGVLNNVLKDKNLLTAGVPNPNTTALKEQHAQQAKYTQGTIDKVIAPQIEDLTTRLATATGSEKAELEGQLKVLNATRDILVTTQAMHETLGQMPNMTSKYNNNLSPEALTEKISSLNQTLQGQIEVLEGLKTSESGVLAGNALGKTVDGIAHNARVMQGDIGDTLAFLKDPEMVGLRQVMEKPVSFTGLLRDYQATKGYIDAGRREAPKHMGKETADLEGFKNVQRNDNQYGKAHAKRFAGLSQEINATPFKSLSATEIDGRWNAIESKIRGSFKNESGKNIISQDKIDGVVKVYKDQFEVGRAHQIADNTSEKIGQLQGSIKAPTDDDIDAVDNSNDEALNRVKNVGSTPPPAGFGVAADQGLNQQNQSNITGAEGVRKKVDDNDAEITQLEARAELSKKLNKPIPEVELSSEMKNFIEVLSPLNSPGDAISLSIRGEAGVRLFGPLGFKINGGAGIEVSIGDEGKFIVKTEIYADGGIAASSPGGKASIEATAGGKAEWVYTFDTMSDVNTFLLKQFEDAGVSEFFEHMDKSTLPTLPGPTVNVSTYAQVSGKFEISDNLKIEGALQYTATTSHFPEGVTVKNAQGKPVTKSENWSQKATLDVSFGIATLKASYERSHIDLHPIPENAGDYHTVNGSLTFELLPKDITEIKSTLANGGQMKGLDVYVKLEKVAIDLGLSGTAATKFIHSSFDRFANSIDSSKVSVNSSVKVGIGLQMQWEVDEKSPDGDHLQYVRVGAVKTLDYGGSLDVGVAYGSINLNYSAGDYTEVYTGEEDITYLQGLARHNPAEYLSLKALKKEGGNTVIQGKSLNQWEQEWQQGKFD